MYLESFKELLWWTDDTDALRYGRRFWECQRRLLVVAQVRGPGMLCECGW